MLIDRFALSSIPEGYCQCGCGQRTNRATMTSKRRDIVKGQYNRFVRLHHRRKISTEQRFWSHVDKSGGPESCWPWTSSINPDGYGSFRFHTYRKSWSVTAHRVAYELSKGELPAGTEICHSCNNRSCQNPAHLYAGTHTQNMHDSILAGTRYHPHDLGDDHPQAKLTSADVISIRAEYASRTTTMQQLADRFHVSISTISNVVNRKNWTHLP